MPHEFVAQPGLNVGLGWTP